jgi:rod shape-determining protein MreC
MKRLFQFVYQYRAFFTFIILEILCAVIITMSNRYQNSAFFNSSNAIAARIFSFRKEVNHFFSLSAQNMELARENAFLRKLIAQRKGYAEVNARENPGIDTVRPEQFGFILARVINNSVRRTANFITLDKGIEDGIAPGMGVISSWGIAGKVKACSKNFSTVYSVLHSDMMISSLIQSNGVVCTTSWTGEDPSTCDLLYVPRHVKIARGDSVVTSGYNSIFPEGEPIGIIHDFWINENETFYRVKVKLSTDFTRLAYVYVITNRFRYEKDSLEQISTQP